MRRDHLFYKRIVSSIILMMCFLSVHNVVATPVKGVVLDNATLEPLPFVNIWIKGTTIGTSSDVNGKFELDYSYTDSTIIAFSFVGYEPLEHYYNQIKATEEVKILLKEEKLSLAEVKVRPDNHYARSIIKSIIKNKKRNNPDNIKEIDYKKYSRKSIFLSNLNKSITEKKSFRSTKAAFITQSDSTVAMPIFLIEKHFAYSVNKDEKKFQETLEDSKQECIMPQMQNVINTVIGRKITSNVNFYDNQIDILNRGLPSPIAWNNQMYYNIYLADSLNRSGVKQYKFEFYPKSYRSTAMKGHFWIDSNNYSLTELHAKLPKTANVNFVKHFEVHQYFQPIANGKWFFKGQKIKAELSIAQKSKKRTNLTIQNISDYHHVKLPALHRTVTTIDALAVNSSKQNGPKDSYEIVPFDSLEMQAYQGIKKLKENKLLKHISKFSDMTLTGYYNLGKIDLGSYMDIYRKNKIEGSRFTLPLRTNENFSKTFSVGGYVGYGFKDKAVKYGGKINYKLPFENRTILTLKYDNDYYSLTNYRFVDFIRENPFEAGGGNILSSFTTRVPNPYMLKQQKVSLNFETQMKKDIGLTIRPFWERYNASEFVKFNHNTNNISSFNNYGVLADLRFSFNQPFDDGFFYRIYYGNQKPVIHLSTILGRTTLNNGDKKKSEPYFNVNMTLKNRMNFGPSFLKMMFNVGYIGGNVPYPLLHMPRGTRDLGFARYHYNLLFNSSFASDIYSNLHMSLNGGGVLLGKFPLLKRLNLRESVSFKGFWGKLSKRHEKILSMPDYLRAPTKKPYMELGFGVTNIFKVLRIEYIRRLNAGAEFDKFSSKDGVRFRIEVSF
ncbi:carboxypeptidase-like regulatory domain-containing protein [Prolixibacteraceae bacterium JC049]|nr:carboxypeptidase-like regulatory domain-containing protein [Prolixibacteraceae bacterium JC049]